ncbi:ABC transporter ATP-binding protein [Virgibacillus sp. C22-A2]|uniref:ABC transporter ATP-binding protein n=1 Tax=Virgibacillus tibetensis TaxID=3042313 RepID=A0ABU6KLX1_9BACI|nr:ABC transporter ATP-binding protein [Virgibacillus sp. C22-A2]
MFKRKREGTSHWFWSNYSQVTGLALLSMFVMIIYMLTNFLIIGVQKWIIDDVFIDQQYDQLPFLLIIFAVGFIGFGILNPVSALIREAVFNKFSLSLSKDFMTHVSKVPLHIFQSERIANYVYYFSKDIRGLSEAVTREIPTVIQQGLYIILLMGVIGFISPLILLIIIIFSVFYIILGRYFGPKMKQASSSVQEEKSKVLVHIEEGISSTREVIAFHRQKWEKAIYDRLFGRYFTAIMKEGRLENKHLFLSDPMRWGANIVILGYGGYLVINGQLSIGWLVVIYQFGSQLMDAMQFMFQLILRISGKMAHFSRLNELFNQTQVVEGDKQLSEPIEHIKLSDVTFSYHQSPQPILESINVDIKKGQKVAFVGTSGGGKSTLLQLLSKDNSPDKGNIIINHSSELKEISSTNWSQKTHIVFQEPYLFQETLLTNIHLGANHITKNQIVEACKAVQIHEFIMTLPDNYETIIGERGITLSGGQRQRVSLARAIVNNPDVLLLDEATSALDMATESRVQSSLDSIMREGIMVVVAHRLSTIENADVIYVLDKGEVVEYGTHESLLKEKGVYKRLYLRQKDEVS